MKLIAKRSLAWMLSLLMVISLLSGMVLTTSAASVNYKYSGQYLYNWGTRDTVATFLSPNAIKFYEDNNVTYDQLAAYAGSSNTSSVPTSNLYKQLQTLMKNNHSHETSYDETRNEFRYTDCQNNGSPTSISAFYSAAAVGPAWDSGSTWNREHTWPNSKGDQAGNGENDIMMLRPEESKNNSSRGNKAYGESGSYYDPNGLGQKVRGDAARIMLYQYVRWGCTSKMWGSSGVIESKAILLKWMEEDPVDTWELGRNDAVEAITGTRNVFVDYPELAFELFEAEIPAGYQSPSGEGADGTVPNDPSQPDIPTPDEPNTEDGSITDPQVGVPYKFGMIQENVSTSDIYYLVGGMSGYYMSTDKVVDNAIDVYLEAATGGYYLYTNYNGSKQYINMVVSGTHVNGAYEASASTVYRFDATSKTLIAKVNDSDYWFGTRNDKTYTTVGPCATSYNGFYCKLYGTAGGTLPDNPDDPTDDPAADSTLTIPQANQLGLSKAANSYTENKYYVTGKVIEVQNTTYGNVYIADESNNRFYIYGLYDAEGVNRYDNMANKPKVGDTITVYGVIGTYNGTEAQMKSGWVTAYTAGSGTDTPVEPTGGISISFEDKANRTVFTTSQQVWEQNGIKVTNDKGASTSNVADYAAPARFYKSSTVKVEYPGMTRLVIKSVVYSDKDYAAPWKDTISDDNATATVDGDTVTIIFTEPVDSFTFTTLAAQARAYTMTVYTESGSTPTPDPDVPGGEQPDQPSSSATLSFKDTTTRVSQSSEEQVWQQNGITVTNSKAASTTAVADYSNPARFYKGSSVTISYPGMTSIVIEGQYANSKDYSAPWVDSCDASKATATISGDIVTITFADPVDSFTISELTAQARAYNITVYSSENGGDQPGGDDPVVPPTPGNDPEADSELTIPQAIELGLSKEANTYTDNKYYVTGKIIGISNTMYGNMYIADEAGNQFLIYGLYSADGEVRYDAMETQPALGDTITVYGIIGTYNGNEAQMKNGWLTDLVPGEGIENNDPQPDTALSIPDANTLGASKMHNIYTEGKYFVTGVISEIVKADFGNLYIEDEAGNKLYVYGTWNEDGTVRYDALSPIPAVGDTITVYGIIGQYNGDPQMKNGWITEHKQAENIKPVQIITQPKAATYGKLDETIAVTVKAEGDELTYQWYFRNENATEYTLSSLTGDTYSAAMSDLTHNRRLYCVITDKYGNSVKTNTVLIRRQATITKESATVSYAKLGDVAKSSVTAVGDDLKYTWYIKNDGATKYSKSSVTKSSYTATMSANVKNRRVYCVVTDKYGKTAQSETFILRESVSITTQPKNASAVMGSSAKLTVKASGEGLKYTWYIKNDGATKYSKSSITKSTYTATMSAKVKNRRVYCVITDKYGNKVQTETRIIREKVSITTQPKSVKVAKGKTAKITVKASGDGLKYTWYIKNAGASKYTKSSVTKSTYSAKMNSKVKGRRVYCVITDKYGNKVQTKTVILKNP